MTVDKIAISKKNNNPIRCNLNFRCNVITYRRVKHFYLAIDNFYTLMYFFSPPNIHSNRMNECYLKSVIVMLAIYKIY